MREPLLLAIEDSDTDFFVIELAVKEAPGPVKIIRAADGEQGLSYLRRQGEFQDAPRPDLVLLNWDLPKKNGGVVLSEMKAEEDLRSIPVVVFTSSERERKKALELGARDFVTKPSTLDGVIRAVHSICSRLTEGSGGLRDSVSA